MAERDGYIPGVPCWIDTSHPDPQAVLPFYSGLFGWEFENVAPDGSPEAYFIGRLRGGDVAAVGGAIPAGAPQVATWNTYVWVANADESVAAARDAGGAVLMEPFDVTDSGRMAVLTDPEGATFCVWQANSHKGARIVNEHGSLNFNVLTTRRPRGSGGVLRGGVRLAATFVARWPDVDAARVWRPPRGDHPRRSRAVRAVRRSGRFHRRRRRAQPDRRRGS